MKHLKTYILIAIIATVTSIVGVGVINLIKPDLIAQGANPRVLMESQGGTATSTFVIGDIIYSDATNKLGSLPIGTLGELLVVSASGIPEWSTDLQDITLANATTTGSLYITKDLTVDGDTTVIDIILTNQQVNGNATTTGYLSVGTANSSFNYTAGDLNASGDLYVGGNATTTGSHYIGNDLTVMNGNVGIGTTTPPTKLTLDTGILRMSQDQQMEWYVGASDRFDIYGGTDGLAHFRWDGSDKMVIDKNTGNVGIGTTTPSSKLHVYEPSGSVNLTVEGTGGSDGAMLILKSSTQAQYKSTMEYDGTTGDTYFRNYYTDGDFRFFLDETSEKFTILNNGNIGIGEVSPGSKLSVSGGVTIGSSYDTTAAPSNGLLIEGNVGIGTTSPISLLDIFKANGDAAISLTASSTAGVHYAWTIGTDLTDGSFRIASSTALGTNDRFFIDNNGNVGIGVTDTTSYKLYVVGSIFSTASMRTDAGNPVETGWGIYHYGADAAYNTKSGVFQQGGSGSYAYEILLDQSNDDFQMILGGSYYVDYDHPQQTNPTFFIQSATNPDTSNDQWLSLAHDQTDSIFDTGMGGFVFNASSTDSAFVIKSDGNVGIGTTSPDHVLHIDGGGLCIDNAAGDCGSYTESVGSATTTGSLWVEGDARVVGTLDQNDIAFHNLKDEVIWTITEGDRVGEDETDLVLVNQNGENTFIFRQDGTLIVKQGIETAESKLLNATFWQRIWWILTGKI